MFNWRNYILGEISLLHYTSVMKKTHMFFLKQPYRVWYQIKAKNKNIAVTFVDMLFFSCPKMSEQTKKVWYTRLFMSFIAIGK